MLLLRVTHRPIVMPPIPERDFDPSQLPSPDTATAAPGLDSPPATPDHLRNNHAPLPVHPILSPQSTTTAEEFLLPKALTTNSVRPATSLVRSLSGPRDWLAETLYILRPLVYGMFLNNLNYDLQLTIKQHAC